MTVDRQTLLEKRIAALRRQLLLGRLMGAAGTGALAMALSLAPGVAGRSGAAPAPAKAAPLTVRAPFTVVDALGAPQLKVGTVGSERGVFLSARGNETAATLGARAGGGFVRLMRAGPSALAVIDLSYAESPGLSFGVGDTDWLHVGTGPGGNARLLISSRDGKPMAGIGEDLKGSGGVAQVRGTDGKMAAEIVGNALGGSASATTSDGTPMAQLTSNDGRGAFKIYTGAGKPVAAFGEDSAHPGAGVFALMQPGGGLAVDAGFNGSVGFVRAYPQGIQSFIIGKIAGQ
jgi:hypothetical protein